MKDEIDEKSFFDDFALNNYINKPIQLQAGKGRAVSLGVYSKSDPEPDFTIEVTPPMKEEDLAIAWDHADSEDGARYVLFYSLMNFGSQNCTVILRSADTRVGP